MENNTFDFSALAGQLQRLTTKDDEELRVVVNEIVKSQTASGQSWLVLLSSAIASALPAPSVERISVVDGAIPPLIKGTRGRFVEFTSAKGAPACFCTIRSIEEAAPVEWGQILFWREKDILLLRAGGSYLFWVEITQPDPAAAKARPGGLRPSGKIIRVELLADEQSASNDGA